MPSIFIFLLILVSIKFYCNFVRNLQLEANVIKYFLYKLWKDDRQ